MFCFLQDKKLGVFDWSSLLSETHEDSRIVALSYTYNHRLSLSCSTMYKGRRTRFVGALKYAGWTYVWRRPFNSECGRPRPFGTKQTAASSRYCTPTVRLFPFRYQSGNCVPPSLPFVLLFPRMHTYLALFSLRSFKELNTRQRRFR